MRNGPNQKEVEELRRDDESASGDNYLNQCLFVRTLNLDLNADDWKELNHEIDMGHTLNSITEHGTGTPSGSPSTQTISSRINDFGTQRTVSDSSTSNRLTISTPPAATVSGRVKKAQSV